MQMLVGLLSIVSAGLLLLNGAQIDAAAVTSSAATSPKVTVNKATYTGLYNATAGVEAYLGIPFAQPPIGKLRFQPPVKATPKGQLDATKQSDICIPLPTQSSGPTAPASEDCLYLNVYRPHVRTSKTPLPVVLWIYGGAFEFGSIQDNDPTNLVAAAHKIDRDIIYVAANYRVGGYGFLSGPEIAKRKIANLGLRDQRLAIEWVQENVAAFGGDPSKVTLWGESAGSISIAHQLVYKGNRKAQPLYRSVYMNSGSAYRLPTTEASDFAYNTMAKYTKCNTDSRGSFTCLQSLDVAKLNAAIAQVPSIYSWSGVTLFFSPTVDGYILPKSPDVLVAEGSYAQDVTIVNGDKDDEGTILVTGVYPNVTSDQGFANWLSEVVFPKNATGSELAKVAKLYPNDPAKGSPYGTGTANQMPPYQNKRVSSLFGDYVFQAPRRGFLNVASKTQKTYSYLDINFKSTKYIGAYHSSELQNYYGRVSGRLTNELQARLANFVVSGVPNAPGYSKWPLYSEQGRKLLVFNESATMTGLDTFRDKEIAYIGHISNANFP